MKPYLQSVSIMLAVLVSSAASAQELPQFPGPEKQHQWLHQFVGQWVTEAKGSMGPDQPAIECHGTMTSRMLGDLWLVNEMKGEPMGVPMVGIQTIGYDPEKKRYVATWVDSMMNHMWHYEGTVDETGKTLILEAEGPDLMNQGKTAKYRDSFEFKSPDHIIVTSSMLDADGRWVAFMTGHTKRKP